MAVHGAARSGGCRLELHQDAGLADPGNPRWSRRSSYLSGTVKGRRSDMPGLVARIASTRRALETSARSRTGAWLYL